MSESIYDFIVRVESRCLITYRKMQGKHHCDIARQLNDEFQIMNKESWSSSTPSASIHAYENGIWKIEIVRVK